MIEQAPIYVDETHCGGRHVTGLERITLELFSAEALAPLKLTPIRAGSKRALIVGQNIGLPARLAADRRAIMLTPGFPPSLPLSLFGARVIPYIHDLFLMTRWSDLSLNARLYMAGPFRFAVRRLPRFLVNSETTAAELRRVCRPDAEIVLYRPAVRNVFEVEPDRGERASGGPRLVAVGTVEPRKNLAAAARILAALRQNAFPDASLDIIGRIGWGREAEALQGAPGVRLLGYQSADMVRDLLRNADALISTSHDEGLGLPLLEAQYAGLAVIAPDKPVFREVLAESGLFVDPAQPEQAAATIAAAFSNAEFRAERRAMAAANLARWNATAAADRQKVVALLTMLAGRNGANRP